jgi:hypothetical protein
MQLQHHRPGASGAHVAPSQWKFRCTSKSSCPTPLFSCSPPTSTVFSQMRPSSNITLNNAPHEHHFAEKRPVYHQIAKIGAIRRKLDGRACPFC